MGILYVLDLYDISKRHPGDSLKDLNERHEIRVLSMPNNEDELNIYEVNALLFQIISFMSEAERRNLKSILNSKLSQTEHGKDLSSLITGISEAKRRELLKKLTHWYHSKHLDLREFPRRPFSIPVELSTNGFTYMCFIQNISNGGVFIHTDFSFNIDQQITMTFSPAKAEKDITVSGKIVRVDSQGIGVQFDGVLTDV